MAYWTESSWTVFASSAKENLQFKQELPFALIGSDVHCHPRLPIQDDLKTAYLACNFDDRIEIWPLCAIAFPAWGIIPPLVEVLVGQYRLRFEKCAKTSDPRAAWSQPADAALISLATPVVSGVELTMAWEHKSVTKAIARSVTILGSQHPSVWRTRGRRMLPCDHAIICDRGRVWLLDLHPLEKRLKNPAVYELLTDGTYYQVGDMRLSRGPASVECDASVARHTHRQSRIGCPAVDHQAGPSSTILTSAPPGSCQATCVGPGLLAQSRPSAFGVGNAVGSAVSQGVLEGLDCPEMLTSRLTGRLVSINHSRFTRGKLIRVAASAVTFFVASIFLVWLFQ